MKMIQYILSGIIFLMVYERGISQELKSAYILPIEGDTVHGYIDVTGWGMNPSKILFNSYPGDSGMYYSPFDIREFGMEGEVWEGGAIDIEYSARDLNSLNNFPDLKMDKDTVFLQAIVRGNKSLYLYSKLIHELYYIKDDSAFTLLIYKKYLKDESMPQDYFTRTVVKENKTYIGQLTIYFSDCPELTKAINTTEYSKSELEKLFLEYYRQMGSEYTLFKPVKNSVIKGGLSAGFTSNSIDLNYNHNYGYLPPDVEHFTLLSVGALLEVSRPVSLPNWSLYNEFSLLSGYEIGDNTEDYYIRKYSKKIVNMVRYYYPIKDIKLFASAGFANELFNMSREKLVASRIAFGAGVNVKFLSFEIRAEPLCISKFARKSHSLLISFKF